MRLSRRTRLAGVALIAASSLTLAACGGGSDDKSEGGGGGGSTDKVISVYGTNPQNPLIPTATNEVGGGDPLDNLFSGLVAYNTDGSVTNEVAESIEPNEDSTVWTVKLKDDWKFTDGTPVTADSFVKAWNYGANPKNKQLNNYFFYPIKGTDEVGNTEKGSDTVSGLKVLDDTSFSITLKEPESDFPLRLGYSAYMPVPDSAYDESGKITKEYGDAPIGNGPYKLTKSGWEKNKQISLEPNPDYKGVHKPKNGGLVFKFYNSTDSAYTDVQSGNLDVLDQVPPSALTTFESDSAIKAYNEPGSSFSSFTIPERLEHFKGEEGELRRAAISMAINRPEITEKIFNNARTPASDFTSPVLDGWTDKVPGNEVLKFNPDEAKKKWAEADKISKWDGKFELAYNNDGAGNKEFSEAMANQIKNTLGIDAAPKAYPTFDELRTVITDRTIKTPFRTGWQADYPSMLNYLGPIYATGAGSNDGDYSNKDFDKLVSEASAASDDERYKLISEAQSVLLKDLPAIPLWYQNATAVTTTDLKDFKFNWKQKPDYYALTK
ncbi:ABC transporter substrate-binding protein [Aeromicrobium sp. SMF47]|uniref:ABC transporter substrate-binding protein n=1 Tax=Aeromicrobium yanjiei TaxID=2662028 RepID=A0A5Q2MHE4_9ACTN|nr:MULTISPECIES: ABC transporter substrate-binding protein [Aeromicrobium]MRJ76787.1 ABC transporter substrate-binding protein [Aeromicrobium yanjiei]MRK01131.1 ABC transporter substrate-binding protein [Aeromicrobium sp. S22]QGG42078.1 ABC transporter substrate-binding protein [Aeromicrobium yanjiei]